MTAREVELTGGAPWGFRMHGGADQNQPLRISRVNPGRKASLSGIREGDVISSINGRPTKGMTNGDAHAMLRSAGPTLRLGLNEDREVSPRRRSIGKGTELKRPSQLIAEVQKATPHTPIYATIRPQQSPLVRPSSSPLRASSNSLNSTLNSTSLVKAADEQPKFHPTNPFYTNLSNNTSASKLPVPNARTSISSLDRNKTNLTQDHTYTGAELKSPSYFTTKSNDSGPTSLPYFLNSAENMNGYESAASKSTANESQSTDPFSYTSFSHYDNKGITSEKSSKNPFDTKRNSDPFEKYLRPESNVNGKCDGDAKNIPISLSDNNFNSNEEVTKRCTITEHKISEVEEVKTIKKIVLNGSSEDSEHRIEQEHKENTKFSTTSNKSDFSRFRFDSEQNHSQTKDSSPRKEYIIHMQTPTEQKHDFYSSSSDQKENLHSRMSDYLYNKDYHCSPTAEVPPTDATANKPPLKSPTAPTPPSPSKRE